VGIFLVNLLETPLFLLAPIPLAIAVDSVLGAKPVPNYLHAALPHSLTRNQLLIVAAGLQILIVLLTDLQALISQVLQTSTSERLTLSFRSRLFSHVQRLSFAFHDRRGTTDSLYRIQYDTPALGGVTVDCAIPIVSAAITLISVFYVIVGINVDLAIIALAVAPVLALLSARYKNKIRVQYKESKQLDSSAMAVVQEALSTFRVVKAFGREDAEHERFLRHADRSVAAKIRLSWTEGLLSLLVDLVTAFGTGAVLYVGVRDVQSGALTLGELLVVINYLSRLYSPLRTVARKVADLQGSLASAQRGFEILDEEPEIRDRPDARPIERAVGDIELRGVSFDYNGEQPALREVSLAVPAGTRVGIAGRSGAGKTTLISLLMRFYDPTFGAILLDGVDLREYRIADLRSQFALVLQEPVLFATSIRENIAYGRPDAALHDIVAAAETSEAHRFITALPDGYDTLVGERGMRLSGGERQRISLARAFLTDAPILILDEPTSSVDVTTEAAIMKTMRQLMDGRTTFMIAHRLSTLQHCDVILEIENGRLSSSEIMTPTVEAPEVVTPNRGSLNRTAQFLATRFADFNHRGAAWPPDEK
jgi:ATP-binding cassette subfamily B protein